MIKTITDYHNKKEVYVKIRTEDNQKVLEGIFLANKAQLVNIFNTYKKDTIDVGDDEHSVIVEIPNI